ncbi:hypothetical protein ABWL39_15805 [Chitinivorax sp. PXF-14]|uniref:hypothetical protein n=1 Tax=Chitinivorax sp. PXF-14 TaxID=3230488 RepID=UPI003467160A
MSNITSIPTEILMKIEAECPELAPLVIELAATTQASTARVIEGRLAQRYLAKPHTLTAEQALALGACLHGRAYGDISPRQLH